MHENRSLINSVKCLLAGSKLSAERRTAIEQMHEGYVAACQVSRIQGPRKERWLQIAKSRESALREVAR